MAAPSKLTVGDRSYEIFRLAELQASYDVARLPYTLRVLLENVLRNGDEDDVRAVATWDAKAEPSQEISFAPSRVLLQDLTGVPAVVDLAAMRNAMSELGGDPGKINPLIPAELVIDHSVQVDSFASRTATDLVLTVTEILRRTGVVGKFVEYFGEGLARLPLADRATIGNMSPEYGATCGFFPVDQVTIDYLRLTGRDDQRIALVEAYCK